jgi:hypothetical protein
MALAGLLLVAGTGSAGETEAELKALIERQGKLIEEQGRQLEEQGRELQELKKRLEETIAAPNPADSAAPPKGEADPEAMRKIIADYLRDNPGAGMPPSVQTGYNTAPLTPQIGPGGFVIRSAPNPPYVRWEDECRIPFELRIRGRLQLDYYRYTSTDSTNHLTGQGAVNNANQPRLPDFSQLEIKRGNVILEGTAFDPDLRYRVNFNGFTRGIGGFQSNRVVQTVPTGATTPVGAAVSPIGGGVIVSHGVTLFEAFVAYDMHPCNCEKGCGPDCPERCLKYCPTLTLLAGKFKPFFGLDEILGNQNMQFVEFSMTSLFFSADEDARLMGAGIELRACEDRFFLQSIVTNGAEAFTPNVIMDQYPGFITGFWYDFGGTWDNERKRWQLFGTSISDLDYSPCLVVRAGGCVNIVPHDRRSIHGDAELSRYFVVPSAPGGTRLINLLNGDLVNPPGSHAVDKFDAYTYTAFLAAKYRGLSFINEWWVRNLNNFRTTRNGLGNIIYQDTLGPGGTPANALFPPNIGLLDYGMELAMGYFLVPRKIELAGRWSWIRGQSGDINGDGTFTLVRIPGSATPVHRVNGAFRNFHDAHEYTVGLNWFFRRQQVKWQTDIGWYSGGNPSSPAAQSLAGFLSGVDGYLIRTQLQLFF